ncbi:MAG: hypothetical protein H6577_11975 [Lewinellaceae bacterium]|nr:hypothetical protein [Lewinellaceae bacterium]
MQISAKTFLLLFLTTPLFAQQEIGLPFMRQVWQSNKLNPAVVQPEQVIVEIFGIRSNGVFDGPVYNEIISQGDSTPVVDIDRLSGYLKPEHNIIRQDLEYSTLNLAVRIDRLTLSLGHSTKYHAFLDFPKALPQVIWQGNAQFIGETIDLGHEIDLTGYHEIAFGAAYRFGKLTLGAKAKILDGIANLSTDFEHHSASLYTDPDVYQITLTGDYLLNAANSVFYNGYDYLKTDFTFGRLTTENLVFTSGNRGFAYDAGARLELGKLDLSLSVLDIGKITWNKRNYNYAASKTYTYDGLDFSGALTGGNDASLSNALDTLEALFQPEKTYKSYTTELPRRIYANALFQLNDRWNIGGLFYSEKFRGKTQNAYALGATWAARPWLTLGATYAIKDENKSYDNVGLNLSVQWKFIQIFGATDNVAALILPGESKNFSARGGLALLLAGKEK